METCRPNPINIISRRLPKDAPRIHCGHSALPALVPPAVQYKRPPHASCGQNCGVFLMVMVIAAALWARLSWCVATVPRVSQLARFSLGEPEPASPLLLDRAVTTSMAQNQPRVRPCSRTIQIQKRDCSTSRERAVLALQAWHDMTSVAVGWLSGGRVLGGWRVRIEPDGTPDFLCFCPYRLGRP
jgi:hypothetical protein